MHAARLLRALAADAVVGAVGDHVDRLVDGVVAVGAEGAGDLVGQGAQPLLGPVHRELLLDAGRDGERVLERAEEGRVGGGPAEAGRARVVQAGEASAELAGRLGGRSDGLQARQTQGVLLLLEHLDHGDGTGLGEPAQACGLGRGVPLGGARCVLHEVAHGPTVNRG